MLDVVVVGAGLSGLQAALSAQQAGLSVEVVEARDRVGGKVWSVPLESSQGYADLGAAWINDNMQKRIWSYVEQFGLQVVRQRLTGNAIMQTDEDSRIVFPFGITPEFTPEEKENLEMIRDHIQAASLRQEQPSPKDDALSLDQYVCDLGAGAKTRQMVNLWARVMHGLESTQESAAWFIDYCRRNRGLLAIRADDHTGGNHMRLTTGAQQIPNGLADLLGRDKIHLSSPVMSITDHSSYVTVTTANNKTLQARKCIVSIPSTMYHELGVSPPLPDDVQEVTSSARLGHYNKAIVCYAKPWWRDLGYNGFVMSYRGPVIVGRDTSVDEKQFFALTCFVNGDEGIKWSRLDKEGRRAAVIRHLAELYGAQADSHDVHHPIEFLDQIWMHEPYSQGALAPVTALGHYTRFSSVYGQPVGNLHFVGTEYSPEWKGYMEGALCSGEKGADQVRETLAMEDAQRKRD